MFKSFIYTIDIKMSGTFKKTAILLYVNYTYMSVKLILKLKRKH